MAEEGREELMMTLSIEQLNERRGNGKDQESVEDGLRHGILF